MGLCKLLLPTALLCALGDLPLHSAQAALGGVTGQSLQGGAPPQPIESDSVSLPKIPSRVGQAAPAPSGIQVVINEVVFSGNKLFASDVLRAELGEFRGQSLDSAALNRLVERIADHYRRSDYPFTKVVLPPQDLSAGVLRIDIVEGRYGVIRAEGEASLAEGAQAFLDHGLRSGEAIGSKQLERTMLILNDQPGVQIQPVLRAGSQTGEGDLIVGVEPGSRFNGVVGVDNFGNRNTGAYRLPATLNINRPFRFGDRITLSGLVTDEGMWLGGIDYETPLGASGLHGAIGYAHTNYQLSGQFANTGAKGFADIATAKLSYPLVRSQNANLLGIAGLQHKHMKDEFTSLGLVSRRTSQGGFISAQFDWRDSLLGKSALTYGLLNATAAQLHLDDAAAQADALTANTRGWFSKINLDVARLQDLYGALQGFARFAGQWADKNLDSSEKIGIGGYYGVRAYPLGEGMGDRGWLAQLELRYLFGNVAPFGFYDLGKTVANVNPWDANSSATRNLAGAGMGVRARLDEWTIESTLAWRTRGGVPTAESIDRNPRLFASLSRTF